MKLSIKIILLTLAVAMTVGIILALWTAERMRTVLMDELAERGRLVALSISETQLGRMTDRNVVDVTHALHRLVHSGQDLNYCYLTDFDGSVFAHSFDDAVPAALLQVAPGQQDAGPGRRDLILDGMPIMEISLPLLVGTDARIHVGLNTQYALQSIRKTRLQLIAAAFVVGLIVSALSMLLSARLSRPIQRLAEQLEDYGHGKQVSLNQSFFKAGGVEVSAMAENFSRMIEKRQQAEAELLIAATAFESHESMMITDAKGVILRVNHAFTESTGYTPEEAVGQTPRMLKSGYHTQDFYRAMWETIIQAGSWQGEIWDRRKNGEIYPKWLTISAVKGNDGVVTHYVGSHIDITARKMAEEKIEHLAYYDALTGLPNRRLLMDRLQQALASSARSGRQGALLLIDLDNFKTLNDTLGHDVGDLLLQQIAQNLEPCVREGDTVARLGGDEFVVVLENLSAQPLEAAAETESIGDKILAALNKPHQLASRDYRTTSSVGVTLFIGHQSPIDELMKQADIAMYQAKSAGRNTLRFFDLKMQETINERASLEIELHNALEQKQFQLHYQVQVDNLRRPLGAEALIRWSHPARGLVSPTLFIPLAEETGLILRIGQWVLDTACAQIKAWEKNALSRELILAVNVSAREFRQHHFVEQVQAAVQRHAINPKLLKLELTESMLLENVDDTISTMNALNEIGIQFSLDDFGTGYSSLQYLKQLPLDQLKIDRSFVRDITVDTSDKEIVRTIVAMAQSLHLDVIAEGVETEEQMQLLLEAGCTNFQGYLFSKPVPIEQLEAFIKQG